MAPLNWIDDGVSAVALFYVLSGTVLGISLRSFQLEGALYIGYAAKRAFRLLPMIIVSCSIGFLYAHSVGSSSVAGGGIFAPEFYNFYQLNVLLMNGRTLLEVGHGDAHGNAASNLFDLTVASILIVLLMGRRANWVPLPLLRFLGDISYPLYALHWPILCFLLAGSVQLLGTVWIAAHIEIWTISMFVGSALLLVALAWGGYRCLERPAIAAGKRLTNSLTRRTRISTRMADSRLAGGGAAAVTRTEINGV